MAIGGSRLKYGMTLGGMPLRLASTWMSADLPIERLWSTASTASTASGAPSTKLPFRPGVVLDAGSDETAAKK